MAEEWDPTAWNPEREAREERRQQDRLGSRHGVDRDTVNAWLRAIWLDFERKLDAKCQDVWRQTGVSVPDASKSACRRIQHERLREEFGRSLPDKDFTDAIEQRRMAHGGKSS